MVKGIAKTRWDKVRQIMQDGFNSSCYLFIELLIASLGFGLGYELEAMATLLTLLSIQFVFCEDSTGSMFTFCLMTMIPLGFYGASPKDFFELAWLFAVLPPCFIAHLCLYPRKNLERGDMMLAIGLYSIALLLGGIGSISAREYLQIPPLYYILVLGPAMICFYIYFEAYIPSDTSKVIDHVTRGMITLGCMILLMWMFVYIEEYKEGNELSFLFPHRQWKNNIGNFTLLAAPFAFYASTYKKGGWIYFLLGLIECGAIILSGCRGGSVAIVLIAPFMIIYTIVKTKKVSHKAFYSILTILIGIFGIIMLIKFKDDLFYKLFNNGLSGRGDLYNEAWQNFLSNPIFGVGIGYRNDRVYDLQAMAMFWYHSSPLQAIGSMGIIGALTWGYLTFVRFRILIKKNIFNIFMFFSILGFEGYSAINTGDYSPFPFVTFLTYLLTVTSKHNKYVASQKALEANAIENTKKQESEVDLPTTPIPVI